MKRLPGILFLSGVVIIGVLVTVFLRSTGDDYAVSIENERKEKDHYMMGDPASPFVVSGARFTGLHYFKPDERFRVQAKIIPLPVHETVRMNMNDGTSEIYFKFATVQFELMGKQHKVTLYKPAGQEGQEILFLPFFDETSAFTTYGGGRYLDLEYPGGNDLVLDFNKAYNPYCAYVKGYTCPLPPPENRVEAEVTAGEKIFKSE